MDDESLEAEPEGELDVTAQESPVPAEGPKKQDETQREIGNQAVWSLSSCKQGFGVRELRDGSLHTYWQSDGPQPHLVNIQFHRKTAVSQVRLYIDYTQDESYTPQKLSVRVGTTFHDLREVVTQELQEPDGWVVIPLDADKGVMRTHLVQVAVLSNHQNGRDTHVRLVQVYSPLQPLLPAAAPFTTKECAAFGCIR
eukprot:m.491120 g.491120  ORF g.491120 m.491120 type:complete len:197 (-) comp29323_c0_seq1:93-683(-)